VRVFHARRDVATILDVQGEN